MSIPEITVYSFDLMSSRLLATLPIEGLTWTRKLNAAGTLSGKLNAADPAVKAKGWQTALRPSRTLLVVDVDGAIEWAGILWDHPGYDSASRTLSIAASEAWSYFAHRVQAADYTTPPAKGPGHAYWSANPAAAHDIAAALIADALASHGSALAGMAIDIVVTETDPNPVTESFPSTQRQALGSIIQQIAATGYGTGFDYSIEWAWSGLSGSTPVPTLVFSYPRAGRLAGTTGLVVDVGTAAAKGYSWPIAGSAGANSVYGSASGGAGFVSSASDPAPVQDGYPLLEAVKSYTAINTQSALDTAVQADLAISEWPSVTPSVTVSMSGSSLALGDFTMGDDMRVIVPPDDRFPAGLDTYLRVATLACSPQDQGLPTMTLTFAVSPALAPVPPPPGV